MFQSFSALKTRWRISVDALKDEKYRKPLKFVAIFLLVIFCYDFLLKRFFLAVFETKNFFQLLAFSGCFISAAIVISDFWDTEKVYNFLSSFQFFSTDPATASSTKTRYGKPLKLHSPHIEISPNDFSFIDHHKFNVTKVSNPVLSAYTPRSSASFLRQNAPSAAIATAAPQRLKIDRRSKSQDRLSFLDNSKSFVRQSPNLTVENFNSSSLSKSFLKSSNEFSLPIGALTANDIFESGTFQRSLNAFVTVLVEGEILRRVAEYVETLDSRLKVLIESRRGFKYVTTATKKNVDFLNSLGRNETQKEIRIYDDDLPEVFKDDERLMKFWKERKEVHRYLCVPGYSPNSIFAIQEKISDYNRKGLISFFSPFNKVCENGPTEVEILSNLLCRTFDTEMLKMPLQRKNLQFSHKYMPGGKLVHTSPCYFELFNDRPLSYKLVIKKQNLVKELFFKISNQFYIFESFLVLFFYIFESDEKSFMPPRVRELFEDKKIELKTVDHRRLQ